MRLEWFQAGAGGSLWSLGLIFKPAATEKKLPHADTEGASQINFLWCLEFYLATDVANFRGKLFHGGEVLLVELQRGSLQPRLSAALWGKRAKHLEAATDFTRRLLVKKKRRNLRKHKWLLCQGVSSAALLWPFTKTVIKTMCGV